MTLVTCTAVATYSSASDKQYVGFLKAVAEFQKAMKKYDVLLESIAVA